MLKDKIKAAIALMEETEGEVLIFDAASDDIRAELTAQGMPLRTDQHGNQVHATEGFSDWAKVSIADFGVKITWGHH